VAPKPQDVAKRMVHVCELLWKHGDQALDQAKEADSPLRGRNYDSGRSAKGGVADRTGDVASGRAGRSKAALYDRMAAGLIRLDRELADVETLMRFSLAGPDAEEAKRKLRPRGSGDCGACGVWVSGEGNDRVKSGYCPKHYTAWGRAKAKGESRSEFEHRMRGESDDP
jgi:hypothetical protein